MNQDGDVSERRRKWFQDEFDNLAQSSLDAREIAADSHTISLHVPALKHTVV